MNFSIWLFWLFLLVALALFCENVLLVFYTGATVYRAENVLRVFYTGATVLGRDRLGSADFVNIPPGPNPQMSQTPGLSLLCIWPRPYACWTFTLARPFCIDTAVPIQYIY